MKTYIEKCLRRNVTIKENRKIIKELPLKFKGSYLLYSVFLDGVEWMLIRPKMEIRLNSLKHDHRLLQKTSGLNCAFYFTKLSHYSKESMMNEGIPFIIENKQMFLPFLGMLLSEKNDRKLQPVHKISYLTQKLLLCALYEEWHDMNVTNTAKKLGVSKMSASRCFDEIEYLDLPVLDTAGKNRKITVSENREKLWKILSPILRNPVITRYELTEDLHLPHKAGITALCEYSMLADNSYPTYGITKKELREIRPLQQASFGEEIGCVVLELGYFIDYMNNGFQDPLSVWMSLSAEEKEDERIGRSINEMLKEYVW